MFFGWAKEGTCTKLQGHGSHLCAHSQKYSNDKSCDNSMILSYLEVSHVQYPLQTIVYDEDADKAVVIWTSEYVKMT